MHLLSTLFGPRLRETMPPMGTRLAGKRVLLREAETGDWRQWSVLRELSRDFLKPWEPEWPPNSLTAAFYDGMLRGQWKDWRRGKAYGFLVFAKKAEVENIPQAPSLLDASGGGTRVPPPPAARLRQGASADLGHVSGEAFWRSQSGGQGVGLVKQENDLSFDPPPAKTKGLLKQAQVFASSPARGEGPLVGGITLNEVRRGIAQKGTLGYWIGKPYARQGYMSEAAALMCEFAFDLLKLNRVEASCLPHNEPSKRLLQKLGFSEEGYAKSYLRIDGEWHDHMLWGKTFTD